MEIQTQLILTQMDIQVDLDQTGSSRTFNIEQQSTLASDWLQINSTGSNGTVCVVQSDGGTTTSC